ncbi:MAG TPA: acetolactate decarboxylase [Acidimicrobiales bacterium]|nr:acetolactate decarboxylase [Acidimicrobiales bacterium]
MTDRGVPSDHILGFARSLLSHRVGGRHSPHEVFQTSTIVSLVEGLYDGNVAYGEVMRHGDFGVGTFNALDGEMVALDGKYFHLRSDGAVSRVSPDELTPFAAVTRFRPGIDHTEGGPLTRPQCEEIVGRLAGSDNLFYALRIDGRFGSIRTRTVSKQSKPYPRLVDAAAAAPLFALADVEGTVVGFHTPDYAQGIGVAGYHMHFLSADHQSGGHVFDFSVDSPRIRIDTEGELHLSLQATNEFLSARLAGDVSAEIAGAETSAPGS